MTLTLARLKSLLKKRFGGKLTSGKHHEDGEACVRELRACALDLPWSDHPDGDAASPTDAACQVLNDAPWSSDEARTEGCLPLALLSEAEAAPGWVARYFELTIRQVVPSALRPAIAALNVAGVAQALMTDLALAAARCEREGSEAAAGAAAKAAAGDARAAAGDAELKRAVTLLIAAHKGQV